MITRSAATAILSACAAACVAASACRPADAAKGRGDSAELRRREARLERSLAKRDSGAKSDTDATKPVARWIMPVDLAELSGFALLPKPITPDTLLHKVREVLDARRAAPG